MSYRPDVIMERSEELYYAYDGSFDGLLCCVFECYEKRENPVDILSPLRTQSTLIPPKEIVTDIDKARRVLASIPDKIGVESLELIEDAFLTCLEHKENDILAFLRKGYKLGPRVMNMLADDAVNRLVGAVRHMGREAHLLKGFTRFMVTNGVLVAEIEPKNFVLPILATHFADRYPGERFMIYDKTHEAGLVYQPSRWEIFPISVLELPQPDEEEEQYQELWRLFYKTIEIQSRHNPRCRMSHMPKRYWKTMTEFGASKRQRENSVVFLSDAVPSARLTGSLKSSHERGIMKTV